MCASPDRDLESEITEKIKEAFKLYVELLREDIGLDAEHCINIEQVIEDFGRDASNVLSQEVNKEVLTLDNWRGKLWQKE